MGYFYLALTIILESASIIFMKLSNGFQHKWHLLYSIITYLLSFLFFTLALKHLSLGWANAVWAGTSTVLVALVGIYYFGEKMNITQMGFMALIIIGLVGLNISGNNN